MSNPAPSPAEPKKGSFLSSLMFLLIPLGAGAAGAAVPVLMSASSGETPAAAETHAEEGHTEEESGHDSHAAASDHGSSSGHGDSEGHGSSSGHGGGHETAKSAYPSNAKTALIPVGETIANLSEGRMNRYLRLKFSLLVSKPNESPVTEQLALEAPQLKNWLLSHCSDKSIEDIRGKAGQNQLRREILDHFNATLGKDGRDRVLDVLFEEFNVQ